MSERSSLHVTASSTPEERLATVAVELATAAAPDAEVDAAADRNLMALTRFANSVIHQNVAEDVTTVRLRLHRDGRTATGSATVIDDTDVRPLVERVLDAVRVAPIDPGWPGLAPKAAPGPAAAFDPATAAATPADRAQVVRAFVDAAGGLEVAGYVRTNHWSGALVSSAGQVVTGEAAECGMSGIARHDGADGVARHAPARLADLDGTTLGARAGAKARASADPVELPAGRYEVVLEPSAVMDLLEALSYAGFNGKAWNERRSFVRLGEDQLDPAITIVDDPLSAGQGYDRDGTPHQRLVLIDGGTCVAVAHDRRSAAEAGTESTGHAIDAPFSFGPMAMHLALLPAGSGGDTGAAGDGATGASPVDGPFSDAAVAELVGGVERGVLVSDLWYTRVLDPRTLALTGLTRNGVWLIEDGQLAGPARNFRFTQSYAQALMPGNVRGVGRTSTPIPGDTYSAMSPRWGCPALHLASWNFTGGASG
jgi:predicted Zn-dependent protease